MSGLGWVHFVAGWIALAAGLVNLLARKGTRWHRALGYLFVFSTVLLNCCALSLYRLTGHVNLFHGFAVLSLSTTVWAMLPLIHRERGWATRHAARMGGAYIGLCAAAGNEILTREVLHWVPASAHQFWLLSVLVTMLITTTGILLSRRQRREAARIELGIA